MKSTSDLCNTELVSNLIYYKCELEKINQTLHFQNLLFSEMHSIGSVPSAEQIANRKKVKKDFSSIQASDIDACRQVPNHSMVLKKIRLGEISPNEESDIIAVLGQTRGRGLLPSFPIADDPNLILGLSQ